MSENVLGRIINQRVSKNVKVVGMRKMSILNKIISKRTTLSYGTDFLGKERDRSSGAMRGYESLSNEGKRDVNQILMDATTGVVGVKLQPDSARTVDQRNNEYTPRTDSEGTRRGKGVVHTVLGDVPNTSSYPELQGKKWLSTRMIAGKDFLENVVIKILGIEFEMNYEDMVKFADDPSNPITVSKTVLRTSPANLELAKSLFKKRKDQEAYYAGKMKEQQQW